VDQDYVLQLGDSLLTVQHVISYLRRSGHLSVLLGEVASQFLLEKEIEKRSDITVTAQLVDDELQAFQLKNELTDHDAFQAWLISNSFKDELSFRSSLEFKLKLEQLAIEMEAEKGLDHFIEHKIELDQLVVSRIVVLSQNAAEELRLQIDEKKFQFEELAREYSLTEDAMTNGLVGFVSRKEMLEQIGVDLYDVHIGELVGPVECAEGWSIFRVDEFVPAQYDDETKEFIRTQLLDEWLSSQIQSLNVDVLI